MKWLIVLLLVALVSYAYAEEGYLVQYYIREKIGTHCPGYDSYNNQEYYWSYERECISIYETKERYKIFNTSEEAKTFLNSCSYNWMGSNEIIGKIYKIGECIETKSQEVVNLTNFTKQKEGIKGE